MTQAGLKEDNATNKAEWKKKLYGRPKMTRQARDEEGEEEDEALDGKTRARHVGLVLGGIDPTLQI